MKENIRETIQNKMNSIPYLKECYFVEDFLCSYINHVINRSKQKIIYFRHLIDYDFNYNENTDILESYFPESRLQKWGRYEKNSFFVGDTGNGNIVNECKMYIKYEDSLKIDFKINFTNLGVINNSYTFSKEEFEYFIENRKNLLKEIEDTKDEYQKIKKKIYIIRDFCRKIKKEKNKDWGIFGKFRDICEKLFKLIYKEEELTKKK